MFNPSNVSGMLGTERITLNDNLLNRASQGAVLAMRWKAELAGVRAALSASRGDALSVADDAAQYAVSIRP